MKKNKNKEDYSYLIDKKKHPVKWFTQIFFYRNWVFIIIGVLLAGAISLLTYQSLTSEKYDMRFVIAYYDEPLYTPYIEAIEAGVQEVYPDVNGNGNTLVGVDALNLGDSASVEVNEAYWRKFLTTFSDETYVMYILDKTVLNMYIENEDGLSAFDSTCIKQFCGEDVKYLSLDSSIYFKDSQYVGDKGYFVAFRPKPSKLGVSDELYYADYVEILEMLLPDYAKAE